MLGALSVPLNVEYAPIQAVTLRRDRDHNPRPDQVGYTEMERIANLIAA
jgi:hypothetical protein